jgi:regulatory protein
VTRGSATRRRRAPERSEASQALSDPEGRDADADPVEVAKAILLRQLTSSAKSRHQLAEALARKGVPPEAADEALDRFVALGYVDDEAFARSWVESRQRSRGLAASMLRRELREKGIAPETIDSVIADQVDDEGERAAASALVDKRLRSLRGVDSDTATRRLVSMLARKGYRTGLAYAVVREALSRQ